MTTADWWLFWILMLPSGVTLVAALFMGTLGVDEIEED